ncbi:Protein of unknown function [Faunimonas pinastri]|uniref:DUF3572 family protein n=1 Tax=Faunimonas pinastri TaxID=1855383 RepID=A0A1H9NL59_9HYPH|nr:DUF3572 domain-containing protein [Faunimonas pinastri]SER36389.1 Protein of unknown function [Faunimonas pinastri]
MSETTLFISQTFRREGGRLVADPQKTHPTAEAAIATAERLGARKAGAVALGLTGSMEGESWDEPEVLFRTGDLPPELDGEEVPSGSGYDDVLPQSGDGGEARTTGLPRPRGFGPEAEALAVEVLTYLAADPQLLELFLSESGLTPEHIRQAATLPAFLPGVLEFLMTHEAVLVEYANFAGRRPEDLSGLITHALK